MDYVALKHVHIACAMLSYAGFFVRGVWMIRDSAMLRRCWVRVVPHVVDTLLLASAVVLSIMLKQYPLVHPWLTAKVAGLLIYIGLGMVALRYGNTRRIRIGAWIMAQLTFGYIVAVAVTRNPFIIQ